MMMGRKLKLEMDRNKHLEIDLMKLLKLNRLRQSESKICPWF